MGVTHVDVKEAYRLQTGEGYAYIDVRSIPEYEGVTRRVHTTFPYSITTRRRVNRLRIRSFSRSYKPTIPTTRSCS